MSRRPTLGNIGFIILITGALFLCYRLWSPGVLVEDGRFDLGKNGIWLQHGWLGDDGWFNRNKRNPKLFRHPEKIQKLADRLKRHKITDVFPHLCPCTNEGNIAGANH